MSLALNNSLATLRTQSQLTLALRSWFSRYGYLEVSTPIMVPSPALEEHLEAIEIAEFQKWLHTSPEFAMKKKLAQGLCRIYQIAPCFRKEEMGIHHNIEFRMLEWYRVGASYWDLMEESVDLIQTLAVECQYSLKKFEKIPSKNLLPLNLEPEEWFFRWVDEIEPNLPAACIIYDYPKWQAALARQNGDVAQRFEIYLEGVELANAFDEEGSSQEIKRRWQHSNDYRIKQGSKPYPIDQDFLKALDKMPRCSGIAMGIDRLWMILMGAKSIHLIQ